MARHGTNKPFTKISYSEPIMNEIARSEVSMSIDTVVGWWERCQWESGEGRTLACFFQVSYAGALFPREAKNGLKKRRARIRYCS